MIAANELRKGNYIKSKLLGTNHQVTGLLPNGDIYTSLQSAYSELIDWEPIQLTPAILVDNCGVIDHGNFYSIPWGTNGVEIIKWDDYYKGFLLELGKGRTKLIHDLHTLQNGFHFLTSSELEVKF